ncbi:MAG: hypothetical protein RLZZ500_957 [Bacteroidota bacterium]|jgi:hypothetical protein
MNVFPTLRISIFPIWIGILLFQFSFSQTIKGKIESLHPENIAGLEILNLSNNHVAIPTLEGNFEIKGEKGNQLKLLFNGERYLVTVTKTHSFIINLEKVKQEREQEAIQKQKKETRKQKRADRKHQRTLKAPVVLTVKDHERYKNPFKNSVIGRVFDKYEALPFANVMIKGTKNGVQTDIDGYFGIDAKIGDVLVIHFVGYETSEIKVTHPIMNVVLRENTTTLSEVVVTGYSTKVKRKMTSSVERVTVSESVASDKEMAMAAPSTSGTASTSSSPKAGQLTATEVNDFSHYTYWQGLTESELNQWKNQWKICPTLRYSFIVKNENGYPVVNKKVKLQAGKTILWEARTDNTGRAELWNTPETDGLNTGSDVQITDENGRVLCALAKEFHDGINFYTLQKECTTQAKINIGFMVDATGSMGDEISYLQSELYDVIEKTKQHLPQASVKMSSLFYRDTTDDYVVKNFDFTSDIPKVIDFIKRQSAGGGGDYPEAVIEGLDNAIHQMSWEDDATSKLLFVVLDAPPHYSEANVKKLHELGRQAAEKGIRIIPLAASGIDKSTEYLMRALALETNGTYLTLTNHSGIGDNHISPSAESTKVEMLNELLLRIIQQFGAVNLCDQNEEDFAQNSILNEQSAKDKPITFSYAPNPTTDVVTIRIDIPAYEVFLYDTTGKLIFYKTDKATEYTLDLTGLPNAVYYLKVSTEEKVFYGKIIKRS